MERFPHIRLCKSSLVIVLFFSEDFMYLINIFGKYFTTGYEYYLQYSSTQTCYIDLYYVW